MPRLPGVLAAIMLTALTLHARMPQPVSDRPQLSGVWQLNQAMSEDVPLLPGEAASRARASGLLPAESLRRNSRRGLDLHEALRVRAALRDMLDAGARLSFVRNGEGIVMTDASGRSIRLVPGAERMTVVQGGTRMDIVASWQPSALVVERHYADLTVVTESYATFTQPRQLVITSTIRNPRIDEPAATLMRVYDLVN